MRTAGQLRRIRRVIRSISCRHSMYDCQCTTAVWVKRKKAQLSQRKGVMPLLDYSLGPYAALLWCTSVPNTDNTFMTYRKMSYLSLVHVT